MKKLIIIAVILLIFATCFENVKIIVQGAGGPVPYATVSLGNIKKITDTEGKTDVVKTIFQSSLAVKRLGFKNVSVTLPFSVFYLKYHVGLTPESYEGLLNQLNDMLSGLSAYEYNYSLRVTQGDNTQSQTLVAKFYKGDFSFSNKSDFTGANYTVIYKNGDFYLVKDGKRTLLEGDEKESFVSKNIVFLSANNVVSSILPSEEPENISCNENTIDILWKDAKAVLTVGKNGMLCQLDFVQSADGQKTEVHFSLNMVNKQVEI